MSARGFLFMACSVGAVALVTPASAEQANPILGKATVAVKSIEKNKVVKGKGAAAALQAYYGVQFSNSAVNQANIGYYYGSAVNYYYAGQYSELAAQQYYYASYLQSIGY